ncbi:MAG: prepilin-type N-terminal cleavage/methylation domain-containing protein [Clostridia bacterium]|nr:prepilin-type N-terminal cleavage/methylation domain-containing protein [Clostridia bacterium]
MFQKIKSRIRNRSGFTLTETLMAVLILMLVGTIVAAGVPMATRTYTKIVDSANAQALLSTTMTCLRDELGTASGISFNGTDISYTNASGSATKIYLKGDAGANGDTPGIYIQEYADIAPDEPQYTRLLVSDAASNRNLHATFESPSYNAGDGVITLTNLAVKKGDDTLAKIETFKIRVLTDVS